MLNTIHKKYPTITIHGFSAIEIDYIATISKLTYTEVLTKLKAKGFYIKKVLKDYGKNDRCRVF